jgi:hypothetical protein
MAHISDEESRFLAEIHQKNYLCVAKDCFGLPPIEILAVFWVSNRITKPIKNFDSISLSHAAIFGVLFCQSCERYTT